MKNRIQHFLVFLLLAVLFASCSKEKIDEPENCIGQANQVTTALNNYAGDPSVANCQAYLSALRQFVNSNSCYGNLFFESYQEAISDLEEENCQ